MTSNQVTNQNKENLRELEKTKFFELTHKFGSFLESKDPLAHCISSDFKGLQIARRFERKFPYDFPDSVNSSRSLQQLDDGFIYHLITKKGFFQKPLFDSLRQSLEAMANHANTHHVTRISIPEAGCGLDQFEWHKVERLIKEINA